MKPLFLRLIPLFSFLLINAYHLSAQDPFIMTWNTNYNNNGDKTIKIPTNPAYIYSYDVDWENDGIYDDFNISGDITHTYGSPGVYTVVIRGDFPAIYFNGDFLLGRKLSSIDQWGDIHWQSFSHAFYECENMIMSATDKPDLSNVSDMSYAFAVCDDLTTTTAISDWDVSHVTNMEHMFSSCNHFNTDIGSWDVSNVTNMTSMFAGALFFNQDISGWDVSHVTNMQAMFSGAQSFNQDISGWDVSNVTDMSTMFYIAMHFNQDISGWDVSNVTDMSNMFESAVDFNQDISNWDVSKVTNMRRMFRYARSFNQDISGWNVSNVTKMSSMFREADEFNQDLSSWDVSKVTTMYNMFESADEFNQSLGAWDLNSLTSAGHMLDYCGMDVHNYDATLIGWASNPNTPCCIIFGVRELVFCNGKPSRDLLIFKLWIIVGDMKDCSVMASITSSQDESCVGACDGQATVTAYNGTSPYSYQWNDQNSQTTSTATGLCSGGYTVTVTDNNGVTSTASVSISTQVDNIPPIAVCQGITIQLDGNGIGSINASELDNGSSDNCGISAMSVNESLFNCSEVGINTVILTVEDAFGNTASCASMVTVEDNSPPIADCKDITIHLDATGQATIIPSDINGSSNDNCVFSLSANITSFDCNDLGANSVVLTATDQNGNTSSCTSAVTVEDITPPIIVCQDITVQLDGNGEASIMSSDIDGGTTDNCSFSLSANITSFDCNDLGTNSVILTATDQSGNTSTCISAVTVEDNIPPVAICKDITIQVDGNGQASISPIDIDGGSYDNCTFNRSINISSFDCSDLGLNTVILTITDLSANSATCSSIVTVEDKIPPILTRIDPVLQSIPNNGIYEVQCYSQDGNWYVPEWELDDIQASDNCGVESFKLKVDVDTMVYDCSITGFFKQVEYTWIAMDSSANVTTYSFTLRIVDHIPPTIIGVPDDITVECGAIVDIPVITACDSFPSGKSIGYYDECHCASTNIVYEEEIVTSSCAGSYTMIRRWIVSDNCGNTTIAEQKVTFVDHTSPIIVVTNEHLLGIENEGSYEVECSEDFLPDWYYSIGIDAVTVSDNCSRIEPSSVHFIKRFVDRNPSCIGGDYLQRYKLKWWISDDCGNVGKYIIYIDIVDNTAPVIEGFADYSCGSSIDPLEGVTVTDECDATVETELYHATRLDSCTGKKVSIIKLVATDDCGNQSEKIQYILPEDNTGPAIRMVVENVRFGDTVQVNCGDGLPDYGLDMIEIKGESCAEKVEKFFEFVELPNSDCHKGYGRLYAATWTAVDLCGNISRGIVYVGMTDYAAPYFINFESEITLGCGGALPPIIARDDCGNVHYEIEIDTLSYTCASMGELVRNVTAIDNCGNSTSVKQHISLGVGTEQVFYNVPENNCGTKEGGDVIAIDPCTGDTLNVNYEEYVIECSEEGVGFRREWTTVNSCGDTMEVMRYVVNGDSIAPEIKITHPVLLNYSDGDIVEMNCQEFVQLGEVNIDDMEVISNCATPINTDFEILRKAGDCSTVGYKVSVKYHWTATDICGNKSSVSITIRVIDNQAPVLYGIPDNVTIYCQKPSPPPEVVGHDVCGEVEVEFQEFTKNVGGNEIVYRTWIGTDGCGNVTTGRQEIYIDNEVDFNCEIIPEEDLGCNDKDVVLHAQAEKGYGIYHYQWEIVEGVSIIVGGQGTDEIHIYTGFSNSVVRLTVTDSHGCTTVCYIEIKCEFDDIPGNALRQVKELQVVVFPNPMNDQMQVSTNTDLKDVDLMYINAIGSVQKLIRSQELLRGGWQQYDVSSMTPGTYIFVIKRDNRIVYRQSIVIVR